MNSTGSKAIELVRVFAILFVVLLHARTNISIENAAVAGLADTISRGIGSLGVPLFLLISGYLTGYKRRQVGYVSDLAGPMRRIFKLLTMYVVWNALVAAIALVTRWRGLNVGEFSSGRLSNGLPGIFGLDSAYPIAYQFWFIRELIVLSLVVSLADRWVPKPRYLALCCLAFAAIAIATGNARTAVVVAAFATGWVAGLFQPPLWVERLHSTNWSSALLLSVALSAVFLFFARSGIDADSPSLYAFMFTGCTAVLIGAWLAAPALMAAESVAWLAAASFFVFAFHEPLLTALKKILSGRLDAVWVYAASPLLVTGVALAIYACVPASYRRRLWFVFGTAPTVQRETPRSPGM